MFILKTLQQWPSVGNHRGACGGCLRSVVMSVMCKCVCVCVCDMLLY